MEEKRDKGSSPEGRPNLNPAMLFCERHGGSDVTENICYGSTSCNDAAICILASNFAGLHGKKKEKK